MSTRGKWLALFLAGCAVLGTHAIIQAAKLNRLVRAEHTCILNLSAKDRAAMLVRHRRFAHLWQERKVRSVAADIIPYMQDPYILLRRRAVVALGRLEDPAGEEPLARFVQGKRFEEEFQGIPSTSVFLALGRIRARDKHGIAKVTAIARSVGLSLDDLWALSRKVNGVASRAWTKGSGGDLIVDEVVDSLYQMGKKGENIQPIAAHLMLNRAQALRLQSATLTDNQELRLLVDYLARPNPLTTGDDGDVMTRYLPSLGKPAANALTARMEKVWKAHHCQSEVYVRLAQTALSLGDPCALPVLAQMEKDPDSYVRQQARYAYEHIASQQVVIGCL